MSRRAKRPLQDGRKKNKPFGRRGITNLVNLLLSPVTLLVLVAVVVITLSSGDGPNVFGNISYFIDGSPELVAARNATDSVGSLENTIVTPSSHERPPTGREDTKTESAETEESVIKGSAVDSSSDERELSLRNRRVQKFGVEEAVGKSENIDFLESAYKKKQKTMTDDEASPSDESPSKSESKSAGSATAAEGTTRIAESANFRKAYSQPIRQSSGKSRGSREGGAPRTKARLPTIEKRPSGAPKAAKEYSGSRLEDGSSMLRGQNVTRLSYAIYKVVRLFHLKKLADFPAGSHTEWMPDMVTRFEYDMPGFMYEGFDLDEEKLALAKQAGDAYGSAEFKLCNPEVEIPEGGADMLLVWTELDGTRSDPRSADYAKYIVNVVKAAKKARIKYIAFAQFPRMKGMIPIYAKGRWRFMGKSKEEVSQSHGDLED